MWAENTYVHGEACDREGRRGGRAAHDRLPRLVEPDEALRCRVRCRRAPAAERSEHRLPARRGPARRRLPAPLPVRDLERERRLLARGHLRRGRGARDGDGEGARGGGLRACARARLRAHRAGRERGEPGGAGALRVARLRGVGGPARRAEPPHAAASLISSTSSPTAIVPGWTMSARSPARWTMPLSTPG